MKQNVNRKEKRMENQKIRLLSADEIECRAATVNEKGLSILLYKDARVDQRILDETFGAFCWKRSHQCINGSIYCTVEIKDRESGEWIAKQDAGTAGYYEKEKSQASDSFKRACFNWGIGRELYSAPFVWVPSSKVLIQKKEDKYYCNERFTVTFVAYNASREITELAIADSKHQEVYAWKKEDMIHKRQNTFLSEKQRNCLEAELKRTGVEMRAVQERYHIDNPKQMSAEIYNKVMAALARTKTSSAA